MHVICAKMLISSLLALYMLGCYRLVAAGITAFCYTISIVLAYVIALSYIDIRALPAL